MTSFTMEEILQATGGTMLWESSCMRARRISTDSRHVRKGDLFVALKGPNFDGHHFLKKAFRAGAVGAVISHTAWSALLPWIRRYRPHDTSVRPCVIGVDDPLVGFQEIASYHRCRFSVPLVAVTGSNGKTTAKEMIGYVLATKWRALKTEGNFNNSIGVPHTLLQMTGRHQAAVIEMGVDQEGQTTRLCEIVRPTMGVITNVGPDHLEFFGTIDASARAKAELLPALPSNGIAVLNADDAYFKRFARKATCRVLSYGFSSRAQVRASDVDVDRQGSRFRLHLPGRTRSILIQLRIPGQHNISNALAGAAVGQALGVSGKDIARGLSKARPASMRSEVYRRHGVTYLYDCYNANPASMKAAIDLLLEMSQGKRTIAVLGEMRELGKGESSFHQEIGRYVATKNISCLLTCGPLGKELATGAKRKGMAASSVFPLERVEDVAKTLKRIVRTKDVVLLKASRGVELERVLNLMDSSCSEETES